MSAIYLVCDLAGLTDDQQQEFRTAVPEKTTAYTGKKLDVYVSRHFCAASSHHGFLPSGGIASTGRFAVVVSGSCWTDADANQLSTPEELLSHWRNQPWTSIPPMAGLFSFGYFAEEKMELVIEGSQCGSMPIYYRQDAHGVTIASELKFLLRPGQDKPNLAAVAEYMHLGIISRSHTLIHGIERLQPNSRLIFNRQGLRVVPFPMATFPRRRALDHDALTEYDQMVRRYFRRFQDVSGHFAISLSGGLDSRLVAYAAQRAGLNVKAFTTGEAPSLDIEIAHRVARNLGIPIHYHQIDPEEMPTWFGKMTWFTEGRVHPGHMHYVSANFHRAVPPGPMLNGFGLESVLGGHFDDPALQQADSDTIRQTCIDHTTSINYWPHNSERSVFTPEVNRFVEATIPAVIEDLFTRIGFSGVYSDFINYRTHFNAIAGAHLYIMSQLVPWADVVDPFFDRHAFEFGTTIALADIANRAGQIRWGLEFFPDFASLPRVKSGVLVPVALDTPDAYQKGMDRRQKVAQLKYYIGRLSQGRINLQMKGSFPQYWQWYPRFKFIRQFVDGILLSEQTLDRGLFRREGLKSLLHDCRIGRRVWSAVGTLLVVEMIQRQFLDGTDIPDDPVVPWGV